MQALLGLPPLVTECTNLESSLALREEEEDRPLLALAPSLPLLVQPFTTLCRARHQGDTEESDKMVNTIHLFFVPKTVLFFALCSLFAPGPCLFLTDPV